MLERFLQQVRVERPPPGETAPEARDRLGARFARGLARRMTHLGLLVGAALEGLPVRDEDTVVYATTFAEARATEDYLAGFPTPSPMLFQTSIMPSAVQQVLISRQQAVRHFLPLTGRRRLAEHAVLAALLDPAPRVILAGGEERGTWMLERGVASDEAFAFAAGLVRDPAGATGRIAFEPGEPEAEPGPCPSLPAFAGALAARQGLRWRGSGGAFMLEWL
jgi:hypothetical protein